MATAFRWLLRLFAAALALSVVALSLAYYLSARSLPDYDAEYTLAGPTAPIEIVRDHANVPHIFGANDADVFFGLGFAHAQDRLWQMILLRRTAQGRLSEVFGARTLRFDDLLRRLDLYNLSVAAVDAQDAETRAALDAYAAGVNAWLAQVNADALGRGAPEFFLFPSSIAPWQPADSIAVIKLMALRLSSHVSDEVMRARTALLLPEERVADILPDSPGAGIAALPDFAALFPTLPPDTAPLPRDYAAHDPLTPYAPPGLGGASNVWAAGPSRAAFGASLLANDPHLGFSAPSTWYLARLDLADGPVIGGTIPGLPLILVGRSDALGWGLTYAYVDDQDVFIEALNPEDLTEVRVPGGGFKAMERRGSIIEIKDAPPVTIMLEWTDNGPVIPGEHFNLAAVTPPGHVAALSWTALTGDDRSISAGMALMRAKTIEQGLTAGARFAAPAQNLTLADASGVAMKTVGLMPRRAANHQTQGRMPAPGWIPSNRWQGTFAYAANPEFLDPEGGLLGNTNNKTVERPFPLHVSFSWGDTQRVLRWRRLMQAREVHTRESFIEAQLDTVSFSARALLALVAAELWFTGEPAARGTPERLRQDALGLLANWNGDMNEHLPEPLLYAAWMRALQDRLIRDEMGRLAQAFTHVEPVFLERVFRDVEGASIWCDVIQSAPRETCADMARLALDEALVWISETYGTALESLRWGDAHEAAHRHDALGQVPILSWVVNIRQSTSGGDHTLMRGLSAGSGPEPFLNVHGAGYRGVYDFADPDSSVFIIATGQSGHPLSRHYDDLGVLWRRGEYIPMSLDPDLARAAAVGVTRLVPQ
ncbi:MAG: penicillin acylase family protein [Pseudomonadota bacterium]